MSSPIARMLDANANRAREALRVMEDAARFVLNDTGLCSELKTMRHDLRAVLNGLSPLWLSANRDTPGDVGTDIATPSEATRSSLADVVIAAGKRLSESLRVMEETCKTFDPARAQQLEALRYRGYTIEARLNSRMAAGRRRQWRVCVLLSESLCVRPLQEVLAGIIDGGADCIQVREKSLEGGELVRRVEQVLDAARAGDVTVIVNDRVDVALAAGAHGVHVGAGDLSIEHVQQIAGASLIVGASTHTLDEARAAVQAGADYCGVGAMFATTVKPHQQPSGPAYLRSFLEAFPDMPHLAIGGISLDNVEELIDAGARGVAVSSAVCRAEHPAAVVAELVARFARA